MILLVGETFCFQEPVRKSFLKAVCRIYRERLEERSTRCFSAEKKKITVLFFFTNSVISYSLAYMRML